MIFERRLICRSQRPKRSDPAHPPSAFCFIRQSKVLIRDLSVYRCWLGRVIIAIGVLCLKRCKWDSDSQPRSCKCRRVDNLAVTENAASAIRPAKVGFGGMSVGNLLFALAHSVFAS